MLQSLATVIFLPWSMTGLAGTPSKTDVPIVSWDFIRLRTAEKSEALEERDPFICWKTLFFNSKIFSWSLTFINYSFTSESIRWIHLIFSYCSFIVKSNHLILIRFDLKMLIWSFRSNIFDAKYFPNQTIHDRRCVKVEFFNIFKPKLWLEKLGRFQIQLFLGFFRIFLRSRQIKSHICVVKIL